MKSKEQMWSKELKDEIQRLVAHIGPIQAKVSELAVQLMVTTKEERHREGIHQKTTQRVDSESQRYDAK